MPQFTDKKNQVWNVNLDPVIAMDVREKYAIELTNLETDPLLRLRNDPMILVAVMFLICEEQIQDRGLTPEQFSKLLPFPPDSMLKSVEDAVISFFPTGRASHVREVLASFEGMASKTDVLTGVKIRAALENPRTMDVISQRADREIETAMTELLKTGLPLGT